MRAFIVAALLVMLAPVVNAKPPNSASVARAKACNAATDGKHLSEQQYRDYLRRCLVSKRPPGELFDSARTIERRCNTIANARQLTATNRVQFMQSCRRKGG
ncbi:MAG: hypothetical protein ACRET2_03790 [Steroidobacteraceae bacterium]